MANETVIDSPELELDAYLLVGFGQSGIRVNHLGDILVVLHFEACMALKRHLRLMYSGSAGKLIVGLIEGKVRVEKKMN